MKNIEQLAIVHGVRVCKPLFDVGQGNVVSCTLTELEAFAKAYAQQSSKPVEYEISHLLKK